LPDFPVPSSPNLLQSRGPKAIPRLRAVGYIIAPLAGLKRPFPAANLNANILGRGESSPLCSSRAKPAVMECGSASYRLVQLLPPRHVVNFVRMTTLRGRCKDVNRVSLVHAVHQNS